MSSNTMHRGISYQQYPKEQLKQNRHIKNWKHYLRLTQKKKKPCTNQINIKTQLPFVIYRSWKKIQTAAARELVSSQVDQLCLIFSSFNNIELFNNSSSIYSNNLFCLSNRTWRLDCIDKKSYLKYNAIFDLKHQSIKKI